MTSQTQSVDLDCDPEALRAEYREERDQRLRPEGSSPYTEIAGEFSHYSDDPYVTPGFTHLLLERADHIPFVIRRALDQNIGALEATAEAEADWVATIKNLARLGQRYYAECTPGYYNNEGKPGEHGGFLSGQYGRRPVEFFRILSDWRAEGKLRSLDLRAASAS